LKIKILFLIKRANQSFDDREIFIEPNPTNFDWRFELNTSKRIVEFLSIKKHKKIALFGAPSLYKLLKDVPSHQVTLIDVNPLLRNVFDNDDRLIIADINSYDFKLLQDYDAIVMDPPWY
jgi:hypothetical protein